MDIFINIYMIVCILSYLLWLGLLRNGNYYILTCVILYKCALVNKCLRQ